MQRSSKFLAIFFASAWLVGLGPTVAFAVADEDAIASGVKLRREGRDQDALAMFQKAVATQPTPRAHAQLGLCEHALGLWVAAERDLEEALRDRSDAWIRKNATTLRADLAKVKEKLGSIEVWGSPAGARVSVPGQPAVTLPLERPLRTTEGRQTLTVSAAGYQSQTRRIDVHAKELIREHIELEAIVAHAEADEEPAAGDAPARRPVAAKKTQLAAVDTDGGERPSVGRPAPAEPSGGGVTSQWWFWALIGTVVIAGGASAYLLTRNGNNCEVGTCGTW